MSYDGESDLLASLTDTDAITTEWLEIKGWEECGPVCHTYATKHGTVYYYSDSGRIVIGGFAGVAVKVESRGQLLCFILGMGGDE